MHKISSCPWVLGMFVMMAGTVISAQAEQPVSTSESTPCAVIMDRPLAGFTEQDALAFADLPDVDIVRVTSPFETYLTAKLIRGDIFPPLIKTYCQIGLTQMIVDYNHSIEDDAISAITYRAIYRWAAEADYPGWQIERLGERKHCARGRDQETNLCL